MCTNCDDPYKYSLYQTHICTIPNYDAALTGVWKISRKRFSKLLELVTNPTTEHVQIKRYDVRLLKLVCFALSFRLCNNNTVFVSYPTGFVV